MKQTSKFFKKTDLIIIGVILLVCLLSWGIYSLLTSKTAARAEIYYGSELVETVELKAGQERDITLSQAPHVRLRVYADGQIAFIESDCPDKICINSGRLGRRGQSAACIPNKVILKIVSTGTPKEGDADIVI